MALVPSTLCEHLYRKLLLALLKVQEHMTINEAAFKEYPCVPTVAFASLVLHYTIASRQLISHITFFAYCDSVQEQAQMLRRFVYCSTLPIGPKMHAPSVLPPLRSLHVQSLSLPNPINFRLYTGAQSAAAAEPHSTFRHSDPFAICTGRMYSER